MLKNKIIFLKKRVKTLVNIFSNNLLNVESQDIGLKLKQSRGSSFSNNGIIFAILQRFENSPIMKERFTKYDIEKDKTSGQFFSIGVGKLLRPADLLLEKDLMILIVLSGVVG